ncbi:hypothetical protein LY76DRAFT_211533 [Colletotrichum caudatum]|nr:hypothetical protein LY76DRAFT_211533 [Colletotrichum caudatum]
MASLGITQDCLAVETSFNSTLACSERRPVTAAQRCAVEPPEMPRFGEREGPRNSPAVSGLSAYGLKALLRWSGMRLMIWSQYQP